MTGLSAAGQASPKHAEPPVRVPGRDQRGTPREVKLAATYNGTATDPWGNLRAGLEAETTINRRDWA